MKHSLSWDETQGIRERVAGFDNKDLLLHFATKCNATNWNNMTALERYEVCYTFDELNERLRTAEREG